MWFAHAQLVTTLALSRDGLGLRPGEALLLVDFCMAGSAAKLERPHLERRLHIGCPTRRSVVIFLEDGKQLSALPCHFQPARSILIMLISHSHFCMHRIEHHNYNNNNGTLSYTSERKRVPSYDLTSHCPVGGRQSIF